MWTIARRLLAGWLEWRLAAARLRHGIPTSSEPYASPASPTRKRIGASNP